MLHFNLLHKAIRNKHIRCKDVCTYKSTLQALQLKTRMLIISRGNLRHPKNDSKAYLYISGSLDFSFCSSKLPLLFWGYKSLLCTLFLDVIFPDAVLEISMVSVLPFLWIWKLSSVLLKSVSLALNPDLPCSCFINSCVHGGGTGSCCEVKCGLFLPCCICEASSNTCWCSYSALLFCL